MEPATFRLVAQCLKQLRYSVQYVEGLTKIHIRIMDQYPTLPIQAAHLLSPPFSSWASGFSSHGMWNQSPCGHVRTN
jgi:hypothetical protein